jgi:hypothetical protein
MAYIRPLRAYIRPLRAYTDRRQRRLHRRVYAGGLEVGSLDQSDVYARVHQYRGIRHVSDGAGSRAA